MQRREEVEFLPMSQLSKVERQQIEYHLSCGYGPTEIGKMIGRDKSVISREIRRNKVNGEYVASKADMKCYQRRYWVLTDIQKIRSHPELEAFIEQAMLRRHPWSPEQIAGRWNKTEAKRFGYTVTHPTIYKYLYRFRLDLCKRLCTQRTKKHRRKRKSSRQMIPERVWIDNRPAIIEDRQRLGDYEADTVSSVLGDKTNFLTVVDRTSRYLMVSKSMDRKPKRIAMKMRQLLKDKPQHSCTLDNGLENRYHQRFGLPTFFCHPYSSWQKGQIEYANRLLRRHYPKKTELKTVSSKELALVVHDINNTPRKCLNYKTPHELFSLPPNP